jgi:hypothetical protein
MSSPQSVPDLSGTWEFRVQNVITDFKRVGTLQVTQQGNSFTGTLDWGAGEDKQKLVDGTIHGSSLSFATEEKGLQVSRTVYTGGLDTSGKRITGTRSSTEGGFPVDTVVSWSAERK